MVRALFPGTFDPIHHGHIDIASRASRLFDEVVMAVYDKPLKSLMFSPEERMELFRQDFNGNTRFQLFAPVEPFIANNKSVERNWSPLWSLWRAESNATTHAESKSFLWNLYRKDTTPDSKNVSLLFGLFQYDTNPEATRWRLFHVPVATDRKAGAPQR